MKCFAIDPVWGGKTMLAIIGYGNSLRQDDGAGLIWAQNLAEAFEQAGIFVRQWNVHQLTPELAIDLGDGDITGVIFADTHVADGDGRVRFGFIESDALQVSMGHHLCPQTVLALMTCVCDRNLPAWMTSVPGWDFGHGEGVSPKTKLALHAAQGHMDLFVQIVQKDLVVA
jgi:Ni,Fe-hydrogenase maturation factor